MKSVQDKEIVKKDFVNASLLINKVKKTARETDLYLKKLNKNVLPRCQSADITSDMIKRLLNVYKNILYIYVISNNNSIYLHDIIYNLMRKKAKQKIQK